MLNGGVSCGDARVECKDFLWARACGRALSCVRPHNAAGTYGKYADRIQIGVARSWRSETLWLFRPVLSTVQLALDLTDGMSWPVGGSSGGAKGSASMKVCIGVFSETPFSLMRAKFIKLSVSARSATAAGVRWERSSFMSASVQFVASTKAHTRRHSGRGKRPRMHL